MYFQPHPFMVGTTSFEFTLEAFSILEQNFKLCDFKEILDHKGNDEFFIGNFTFTSSSVLIMLIPIVQLAIRDCENTYIFQKN